MQPAGMASIAVRVETGDDQDSGVGRVQSKNGPVREIRPGDVVWIPPGEKHWHGASPNNAMTHIAMQEALDGSYVSWMEHVTDAEYAVAPR